MSQLLYQQMIIDHSKDPKGFCKAPKGSCVSAKNPMCGDEIQFCCEVDDGVISNMEYYANGCSISIAAASILVSVMRGKKVDEFEHVMDNYLRMLKGKTYEINDKKLEVFSGVCQYPMRVKCASFAWHAAKEALVQSQYPIIISNSAKKYWHSLVAAEKALGVLLAFKQIGCMGWQFVPSVVTDQPKGSRCMIFDTLRVFIPESVIESIKGTHIDYSQDESLLGEGKITFNHPKAQAHCGCGESFFMEVDKT